MTRNSKNYVEKGLTELVKPFFYSVGAAICRPKNTQ